jgi:hypothetical protein
MRNIPIPVDTSRLTFVVVTAPRPRLVSQETGEIKTDKSGRRGSASESGGPRVAEAGPAGVEIPCTHVRSHLHSPARPGAIAG